jgi:D-alanine transaminase
MSLSIAYLDGEFAPLDQLWVSPLDRGFLFADGVYEVVPVYDGELFHLDAHLTRLERSLEGIRLENPHAPAAWCTLLRTLVERNGAGDQSVYLQVTRGPAPRNHAFAQDAQATVFAMSTHKSAQRSTGVSAITRPDNRWGRCDIKSIALLPNVLLRQQAADAGVNECILLRGEYVTEGAASNVFLVREGSLTTPAKGPELLAGITREVALALARDHQISVREAAILESELRSADEIFVTSSSMELAPVVSLDGKAVGDGVPGGVWEKLYNAFQAHKRECAPRS